MSIATFRKSSANPLFRKGSGNLGFLSSIQQYNFEESCANTQNYNAFLGDAEKKEQAIWCQRGKKRSGR